MEKSVVEFVREANRTNDFRCPQCDRQGRNVPRLCQEHKWVANWFWVETANKATTWLKYWKMGVERKQIDGLEDWILRFYFEDDKGNLYSWQPKWQEISYMFRLRSLIEMRNRKKTYAYFEEDARKTMEIPEWSVEKVQSEIESMEIVEALPWWF